MKVTDEMIEKRTGELSAMLSDSEWMFCRRIARLELLTESQEPAMSFEEWWEKEGQKEWMVGYRSGVDIARAAFNAGRK
jgi:hypothetical protein